MKNQRKFNVIVYDFNSKKFEPYDVIPYFVDRYESLKHKLSSYEEFERFITDCSMYQFWSRCEYEIILSEWPPAPVGKEHPEKWDVHQQIMMNLETVTKLFMETVGALK